MKKAIASWIEAMRLRTLPVSVAGVVMGCGCAAYYSAFHWMPALICLLFALIAQIASNFANEYYDYANGLDKKGRAGFRRGVTEGDISPRAMFIASWCLVFFDCLLGLTLLYWGGIWLIIPGIAIAIFAIAYSAGPYPLSHHGLGDIAVIIFFGLVPVSLTTYVQVQQWNWHSISLPIGTSIGLMAANVLIINNYRDNADDSIVGKKTTVVIFGRNIMRTAYLLIGAIASLLAFIVSYAELKWVGAIPSAIYLFLHILIWRQLKKRDGSALNPLLGLTALNLMLFALLMTALYFIYGQNSFYA